MKTTLLLASILSALVLNGAVCRARAANPVEAEILSTESARVQALAQKDFPSLEKIWADDLTYVHSTGRVDSKKSFLEALRTDQIHYVSWQLLKVQARVIGDTAVLDGEYDVRAINRAIGPTPRLFQIFFTCVYARRDGRWQQIAWESTPRPPPAAH